MDRLLPQSCDKSRRKCRPQMEMKASLSQGHASSHQRHAPRLPLETRNLSHPHWLPPERAKFRQIISSSKLKPSPSDFKLNLEGIAESRIDTGERNTTPYNSSIKGF